MNTGVETTNLIMDEVRKVVIGKDDVIRKIMTCFLAKGHVLIDDIPGVGKTTMAMAFSKAMALKQNRIQFTPDVMPSDVTGFSTYDKSTNNFKFKPGAVICNLLLADEINRTSSKTQSALLEAMEEKRVTVDGKVYQLPNPFLVIATQNPVGSIGTHMLPESQLDRFTIMIHMGYPSIKNEIDMLKGKHMKNPMDEIRPIINDEKLVELQEMVEKIFIHDRIYEYIAKIAAETRSNEGIKLGVSPRGSVALCRMAKANAFLEGRDYVTPDDVVFVAQDTLAHRIILNSKSRMGRKTPKDVLAEIIRKIPVDKE